MGSLSANLPATAGAQAQQVEILVDQVSKLIEQNALLGQLVGAVMGGTAAVVEGKVAHGVADDGGAPVSVGGRTFNAFQQLGDGVRCVNGYTRWGHLGVTLYALNSNTGIGGGITGRGMSSTTNRVASYGVTVKFNGATFDHEVKPSSAGRIASSAASVNSLLVKVGSCDIKRVLGWNARTTACFLKVFDKGSLGIIGNDTPKRIITLPPGVINIPGDDFYLANGAAIAITAGPAENDNTPIAAGDIIGLEIIVA